MRAALTLLQDLAVVLPMIGAAATLGYVIGWYAYGASFIH